MSDKQSEPQPKRKIRLVCISDTHNHAPGEGYKLPAGDILIHAGDLTNQGSLKEIKKTAKWLESTDFAVRIVIAGNHDLSLDDKYHLKHAEGWSVMPTEQQECREIMKNIPGVTYLEHESAIVQVNGHAVRIFGSPYSIDGGTQNWAFQYRKVEAEQLWSSIPDGTDIVVTHTPSQGVLDESTHWPEGGCPALKQRLQRVKPTVHVCGHHHEGRGAVMVDWSAGSNAEPDIRHWTDPGQGNKKQSMLSLVNKPELSTIVNASIMKSSWSSSGGKTFNKPIVVDIPVRGQQ